MTGPPTWESVIADLDYIRQWWERMESRADLMTDEDRAAMDRVDEAMEQMAVLFDEHCPGWRDLEGVDWPEPK